MQEPGPQLPDDDVTEEGLLRLYEATNKYAKACSPAMYPAIQEMSNFTKDEAVWNIAVLLLLIVNQYCCDVIKWRWPRVLPLMLLEFPTQMLLC